MVDVRIKNNANGKEYDFRAVSNFRDTLTQAPIPIPITNTAPQSTFLFRFLGQTEIFSFSFGYYDNGADTSNGNPGAIVNMGQQENHLKTGIFDADFDTDFTITIFSADGAIVETGLLTSIEFDREAGKAPKVRTGTVSFHVGSLTGFF